jgi:predicted transposase/invertase (TIGR01784 family)
MIVNDQRVDLEIQVENEGSYPERTLFHWAREYSSALAIGQDYSKLPRVIIISIVDFRLFDCVEYHSEFQALEVTRHTPLTDKFNLHFFELPKLPPAVSAENGLLLWLSLFRARTEEELKQIESLEVPMMKEAIGAYRSITVSPEFREAERLWTKARHDEAQALSKARRESHAEGHKEGRREEKLDLAKKLLDVLDVETIAAKTGLSRDDIEKLREAEA